MHTLGRAMLVTTPTVANVELALNVKKPSSSLMSSTLPPTATGCNVSKGARIKQQHTNTDYRLLVAQKEELIEQLALERMSSERASIVMACLIKRLGRLLADGKSWQVLVTDEEITAIDGEIQVQRDELKLGIVLTLHKPKEVDNGDVGEGQGERNLDPSEAALQEEVQEQAPVETPARLTLHQGGQVPPALHETVEE